MLLPLVVCRCSHQLCYGPTDPLMDFIRHCPSYSITLWAFPWIHNALGNCIIYFLNLALLSSLWYLLLKLVVYVSKKPLWVEHMPSLNCVNPKVFMSHTLLVLRQIKFQHCNFIEREKWMKGYALRKWEATLNFVFMPMDPMWNLSWELLVVITISLITNIWYLWIDPLQPWFQPWLFFFDSISRTS